MFGATTAGGADVGAARDRLPPPGALPGGLVFQPKFDGYRALPFTPSPALGSAVLQSRRGAFIQGRFPDLGQADGDLPDALVIDGELVVWAGEQLSFEALQRRAASSGRTAVRIAEELPAHFIAFDVLQADGQELLREPYGRRRQQLERLFSDHGLMTPWTLCPETSDVRTAQEWLASWTQVPGVEGLVIRGRDQRYLPGVRGWYKMRRRNTTEGIVGAITGTLPHPQSLLLGRYDRDGALHLVARSTGLSPEAARSLAGRLTVAVPGHPWEGVRFTTSWGSRTPLDVVLVEPALAAEIDVAPPRRGGPGGIRCGSSASVRTWHHRTLPPSERAPCRLLGDREVRTALCISRQLWDVKRRILARGDVSELPDAG